MAARSAWARPTRPRRGPGGLRRVDDAVPLGEGDPQAATRIAAMITEEHDRLTIGAVTLRGYPSFHKPVRLAGMRAGLPSA